MSASSRGGSASSVPKENERLAVMEEGANYIAEDICEGPGLGPRNEKFEAL